MTFHNVSAVAVSSGDDIVSDADVIRNSDGQPMIPATALAGAITNAILLKIDSKNADDTSDFINTELLVDIFGGRQENRSIMSALTIDDAVYQEQTKVKIRHMTKLDDNKQVEHQKKYAVEVVEPNAKGCMQFELERRSKSATKDKQLRKLLSWIITQINQGKIAFGAKTNSGLGRIKIEEIKYKVFSKDNINDYLLYIKDNTNEEIKWDNFDIPKEKEDDSAWQFDFKNLGMVCIKEYFTNEHLPNYQHLQSGDKSILSGTSLAGAIRANMKQNLILLGLTQDQAKTILQELYGWVKEIETVDQPSDNRASYLKRFEVPINGGHLKKISRNKINRFTGGTNHGGLFTEKVQVFGEVTLAFLWHDNAQDWMKGLLLLSLQELHNQYISIGGNATVGYGKFIATKMTPFDKFSDYKDKYFKALYTEIKSTINDEGSIS